MAAVAGLLMAIGLPGCASEPSWAEQWKQIKQEATYAYYCDVALCDEIETGYEPECDCWCGYDGDPSGDDVGDGDDSGDDGSGDDGSGDDCGEDGCEGEQSPPDDCTDDVGDCSEESSDDVDDDDGADGCTYTQGYWKNHNEFRTNRNQAVDWPAPLDERDEICGQTLLAIFDTRSHGEAWNILAHQYVAASLNAANGADSSGIAAELDQARDLLVSNCGGIPAADRATAIELAELLDAYNNGVIGPGHCN